MRYLREGFGCVLREHGDYDLVHDFHLRLVKCSNFNKDILGVQANFGMVTVDNGRKGTNGSVGIVDRRVDGRVTNYMEVLAQVLVFLL
jgi:hypothetical protein